MSAAIQIKAPPADPPGSPSAGASAELKAGGQPGPSSSLAPSRPSSPRGLTLPLPLGLPSPAVLDTAGLKMCRNELIHGCVCLADGSSALRAAPAEGAVLILGACPRRLPCDTSSCKYEDDGCLFYHPSVRPLLAPCSHAGLGLTSQLAASSLAEADPVDAGAEHAEVRPWTISPLRAAHLASPSRLTSRALRPSHQLAQHVVRDAQGPALVLGPARRRRTDLCAAGAVGRRAGVRNGRGAYRPGRRRTELDQVRPDRRPA